MNVMLRLCLLLTISFSTALPAAAREAEIIVFAAASLKNALDDAIALYNENSQTRIRVSYAGTGTLARQIEQAAPADLFLSADVDWMDYLQERDLIRSETRQALAINRLALIAPAGTELGIDIGPNLDLTPYLGGGSRLAIADTQAVPAGRYAKAALESLGAWEKVSDQTVATDNVRSALAFVARAETPLGVVYATDATAETAVQIIGLFPQTSHPVIQYPAAVVAGSASAEAPRLLDFLLSDTAWPAFERQGFLRTEPVS
ncbi:MAG: molybdate ABC transporter substrate-binding protein [Hyphomicrobiales bacterium]|nr:molybdate ABC transporter substrate-binding protein [Hyphomicrobiales bacterium]